MKGNFSIPKPNEYMRLLKPSNYTVCQLKLIGKYYKNKLTGKKSEMSLRIHTFLKHYFYSTQIQKRFRGYIQRKCLSLQGVGLYNRAACVNDTDFFTLDYLKDIPYDQFFSFCDADNKCYGFNIISLYSLLVKSQSTISLNPYNRKIMPPVIKEKLNTYIQLSTRCLKKKIIIIDEEDLYYFAKQKPYDQMKWNAMEIFQHLDSLGNYTDVNWFLSLPLEHLRSFIFELLDI